MACKPLHMFIFRILYAASGILVGILAAVVFSGVFHNRHAACWALASAVFAVLSLGQFIYLYVIKEKLRRAPSAVVLTVFGLMGAVGMGVGVGGCVTYLGLGITDSLNHVELYLPGSYYVVCVWTFMVFKWTLTVYVYSMISYKYLKKVPKGFKPIHSTEDDDNESADLEDNDPSELA